MAYMSNYKEEIFKKFEINNRGDYIVMKKLKNAKGNVEFYDLRKYYTPSEGNGEIKPTKQGLRLNYENMVEFMEALIKHVDEDVFSNFDRLLAERNSKDTKIEEKKDKPSEILEPVTDDDADVVNINWDEIDM